MQPQIQKFSLYDGRVELTFNESSHVYKVGDKQVYGVTNIVKVLDKPALFYWGINKTIEYYRVVVKPGISHSEVDLEAFHADAKYATRRESDAAKFIGTMVHDWIKNFINAGLAGSSLPERPVDQNINKSLDAFLAWTKRDGIKFKLSEQKVYSDEHEFAGTLDAEGISSNGLAIIDFKTSTGIYDEYWYQVAAYLFARAEETKQEYAGAYVVRIDKTTGEFEAQYKTNDELEEYYLEFLACLTIYRGQMKRKL